MKLDWKQADHRRTQFADGADCTYLITSDSTVGVLLTRFSADAVADWAVAAEAARNAVRLGGLASPEVAARVIEQAKAQAQALEDGVA